MIRLTFKLAFTFVACHATESRAQSIQRCEGAGGKITYSNDACPEGTKAVRSVQAAPSPSPDAQQSARARADSDARQAQQLAAERQVQQTQVQEQRDSQRAADCAYLRGEADSVRRMRNALVNRPHYSLDDVEQMDQHAARLMSDYQRACTSG